MLDSVYFFDVVQENSENDKPVANSADFSFYGTVTEFADSYLIDMGEETVGFLDLEFICPTKQKITICFGEHLVDGQVPRIIGTRDFSVEYIAKPGENRYINPFRRLAGRYLQVYCEKPLHYGYIGLRQVDQPVTEKKVTLVHPLDQKIYDVSVNTLKKCMHEHYEDCPWREQAMYTMDSRNQMLCGYEAFEGFAYQKQNLLLIAQGQREDGLLSLCFPAGSDIPIPFFSMVYLMQLAEYVQYSGDREILNTVAPVVHRIMDAFTGRIEENGLIAYVQNVAHFDGLTPNWWYLAVIAVLGIALLGAAVLLYRRRKLESAGDFVAFPWLKPIFSVVFTLSMGALFEMFGDLFLGADYVFLTVGIIVGYFVSQMLLQRTVRVFRKKAFAACAAIGVALVLSIGLTAVDPFGITRWTPKPEKVESIILSKSYYYEPDQTRHAQTITNREMIADLVQIHEYILENDDRNDRYDYQAIHLTYKMSDGRQIERRYRFAPDSNTAKKLERFFSAPEFVLGYDDWNDYLNNIGYIELDNYSGFFHELTNAESVELMKSIKADCEAGNFPADAYKEYVWVTIFDDKGNYIDSFDVSIAAGNACDWLAQNVPELFE
jgi:hypothetical protein